MSDGHFFTYGVNEVTDYPEWYKTAFTGPGREVTSITEGQRLLSGVYKLTNGQTFKASLFGLIEEGENSIVTQKKLDTISVLLRNDIYKHV